jgi:hypothetical protein
MSQCISVLTHSWNHPIHGRCGSTNGTAIHGPMNGTGEIKALQIKFVLLRGASNLIAGKIG